MQASSVVLTVHGQLKQWILPIFLSNIRHVKHIYAYGFYCSKFSGDLLRQKPQKRLRHSFASCVLSSAALYMHWINELPIKVVYTTEMETASIFFIAFMPIRLLMFQTTGSAAGVWSVLIVPVHRGCSRLAHSEEDTRWTEDSHRALLQVCFVAYPILHRRPWVYIRGQRLLKFQI